MHEIGPVGRNDMTIARTGVPGHDHVNRFRLQTANQKARHRIVVGIRLDNLSSKYGLFHRCAGNAAFEHPFEGVLFPYHTALLNRVPNGWQVSVHYHSVY